MSKLIHICSGVGTDAVSILHPSGVLVNAAKVLETANSHKQVIKFIKLSRAERVFLDNGMFSFFRRWQDGEMVSYDFNRPVYALIKDMNEAMSSILNFKEFLNDYDFAKGFCEYIFSGFKSK